MDKETYLHELKDLIRDFRDKRDWAQFHNPKDLAEDIAIEASELLECFLWKDKEAIAKKLKTDQEYRQAVEEELADVVWSCLSFANATNIDISEVVKNKMVKNDKKYPVAKAKGRAEKYTKL